MLLPVPPPDAAPFIVREAAGLHRSGRADDRPPAPQVRSPASDPIDRLKAFEDRFADLQERMPQASDDRHARAAGYETISELAGELGNIPSALQRTYWQMMVNGMPVEERSRATGLHGYLLYENKARAFAALYAFFPQAMACSKRFCGRHIDKLDNIMKDLIEQRKAGAPALSLVRTLAFSVKGIEGRYSNYAGFLYPVIKKIIDDLPDRDPRKQKGLLVAAQVAAPGYRPSETRLDFTL